MYLLRFLEKLRTRPLIPQRMLSGLSIDWLAAANCTIVGSRLLIGEKAMPRAYYSERLSNCSWLVNRSRPIPRNCALD